MEDSFSVRLRAARDLRGLSQSQLAQEASLETTSISHFESGSRKPSFDNLRKLAVALRVTTDYLLGLSDTPDSVGIDDPILRHGAQLTHRDREVAQKILGILAEASRSER